MNTNRKKATTMKKKEEGRDGEEEGHEQREEEGVPSTARFPGGGRAFRAFPGLAPS